MLPINLARHIRQVRAGGHRELLRKSNIFIKVVVSWFLTLLCAPVVLFILLIKPVICIRFGTIRGDRIGHFVGDIEAYLCLRNIEKPSKMTIDIIGCPRPTCNAQIFEMWRRTFRITPFAYLWKKMDEACLFWTKKNTHHVRLVGRIKDYRIIHTCPPHLKFTQKENERGQKLLNLLGIPKNARWICIHNRDSAYLDTSWKGRFDYHDYRNFSITSMGDAATALVKRGYYVVRVGSVVAERMISKNPMVIDYSSSVLRSEFLDVFILGNCSAYIGSDSGLSDIPFAFRKPVSYINFSSGLIEFILDRGLKYPFITKRLWHKEYQRYLTLREIFELGLEHCSDTNKIMRTGVEIVDNTSEEILDLAIEVEARLRGNWESRAYDEKLQRNFWKTFGKYSSARVTPELVGVRIGAAFLRKHKDLLN